MAVLERTQADFLERWRECWARREPALIRGGAELFPRAMSWSSETVAARYSTRECNVARDGRPAFSNETSTYAEFFASASASGEGGRYAFTRRRYEQERDAPFIEDLEFPNPLFAREDIERFIFYGGPAETGALPHAHGDAINILVSGEKSWILFDAAEGAYSKRYFDRYWELYREGWTTARWREREYAALAADERVELHEFTQRGGDVVYVPARYCHTAHNETPVMGIVIERSRA